MKKILVFGMYDNAMYHPLTGLDDYLKGIMPDIEFTFTDNILDLCNASAYDGLISYWDDWNNPIPDSATCSLLQYIEQGGALLVLHNGISLQLQDSLENMIGGRFLSHPQQEEILFSIKKHALTQECSDFAIVEEPYQFTLVDDEKDIFLTYHYRGQEYPAGWHKNYKKGQIIFLTPGHTPEKFQNNSYTKLICNCIQHLFQI